jgi:DNA mismatch repair protein MutS2
VRFPPGSWVTIKSIKKTGCVETSSGNSVTVVVGDVRLRCKVADLIASEPPVRGPPSKSAIQPRASRGRAKSRIDLHGLRVLDALSKTAQCLDDALIEGKDSLEIIHGIGEGKVRDAVHRYLQSLSVVRHFALDPLNPGVTKVYL